MALPPLRLAERPLRVLACQFEGLLMPSECVCLLSGSKGLLTRQAAGKLTVSIVGGSGRTTQSDLPRLRDRSGAGASLMAHVSGSPALSLEAMQERLLELCLVT